MLLYPSHCIIHPFRLLHIRQQAIHLSSHCAATRKSFVAAGPQNTNSSAQRLQDTKEFIGRTDRSIFFYDTSALENSHRFIMLIL